MAISKNITVGDRHVMVKELTMQQIFDLSGAAQENAVDQLVGLLTATTDLEKNAIMPYAPSDIQGLVDAILEVNSSFLSQATALGMESTAKSLERLVRSIFTLAFLR